MSHPTTAPQGKRETRKAHLAASSSGAACLAASFAEPAASLVPCTASPAAAPASCTSPEALCLQARGRDAAVQGVLEEQSEGGCKGATLCQVFPAASPVPLGSSAPLCATQRPPSPSISPKQPLVHSRARRGKTGRPAEGCATSKSYGGEPSHAAGPPGLIRQLSSAVGHLGGRLRGIGPVGACLLWGRRPAGGSRQAVRQPSKGGQARLLAH